METTTTARPEKIKHPKALFSFTLAICGHMFAYYGVQAILLAYMVTQMHFADTKGYAIYGAFSGLAYGLPLFCGLVVDKVIGKRKSLIWGQFLQTVGLICVILPYSWSLFAGLSCFVMGNGFVNGTFKALPGDFYHPDDLKGKDAGYTMFYGLFNIGVAAGAFVCGYLGPEVNWRLAFGVAAAGSFSAYLGMIFGIKKIYGKPAPSVQKRVGGIRMELWVYLLCLPVIALFTLIFQYPAVMDIVLFPLAGVACIYVIYISFKFTKAERLKLFAALITFTVWGLFLALYEQSGGSMNLFVLRNMDMHMGSILLPGLAINNTLTGFLPAIMMPLMLFIWRQLSKRGLEPGTILKFVIGFLFMGACFATFWVGCLLYKGTGLVPFYYLFLGYIMIEFSELSIGPIIYSLTYKLSPVNIVGTMMGVLGIAAALGEYMASKIGDLMAVPANITDPVKTLPYYSKVFGELALFSVAAAALFLVLMPLLKKLMQEVR